MAKQSKVAPKGKQAPNTEKKTVKKVAPKKPQKEVKKVEESIVVTAPEVLNVEPPIEETQTFTYEETVSYEYNTETGSIETTPSEESTPEVEIPKQVPLTETELAEKKLEAHYASLGQIDFYLKNIKGK